MYRILTTFTAILLLYQLTSGAKEAIGNENEEEKTSRAGTIRLGIILGFGNGFAIGGKLGYFITHRIEPGAEVIASFPSNFPSILEAYATLNFYPFDLRGLLPYLLSAAGYLTASPIAGTILRLGLGMIFQSGPGFAFYLEVFYQNFSESRKEQGVSLTIPPVGLRLGVSGMF